TTPSRPTVVGAEMLLRFLPSCKTLAPRPHPFLALRLHPLTLRKPLLLTLRLHLLPPRKASLFVRGLHPILLHKVFLPAAGPPPCKVLCLPLRLLLLLPHNLAAPVAKPRSLNHEDPNHYRDKGFTPSGSDFGETEAARQFCRDHTLPYRRTPDMEEQDRDDLEAFKWEILKGGGTKSKGKEKEGTTTPPHKF
ncbi:hypothetical protein DXG01_007624, partial [Tephrocybe rancida]